MVAAKRKNLCFEIEKEHTSKPKCVVQKWLINLLHCFFLRLPLFQSIAVLTHKLKYIERPASCFGFSSFLLSNFRTHSFRLFLLLLLFFHYHQIYQNFFRMEKCLPHIINAKKSNSALKMYTLFLLLKVMVCV